MTIILEYFDKIQTDPASVAQGTLSDILDPRKNILYKPSLPQLMQWLDKFFCRENFEKFSEETYGVLWVNPNATHVKSLWEKCEAEDCRWAMAYMYPGRWPICYYPVYSTSGDSIAFWDAYEEPTPYELNMWITRMKEFKQKVADVAFRTTLYHPTARSFFTSLFQFLRGYAYAAYAETTYNQRSLLILRGFNGISYRGPDHSVTVTPSEELISAGLERMYNYSTDVTSIFPGVKRTTKKSRKRKEVYTYEPSGPTYGVELEISTQLNARALVRTIDTPFFICKEDSSVSGAFLNNIELVTRPMDFREQKEKWGKFFHALRKDGNYPTVDETTNTTNGMHVHIGAGSFQKPSHKKRFCWFFGDPCNESFLLWLSERGNNFSDYAKPLNLKGTRKEQYNSVANSTRFDRHFLIVPNAKGGKTVEVRVFKGIFSYAAVLKNLEFIDSLFYFTMDTSFANQTLQGYLDWLKSLPSNRYKTLRVFLEGIPSSTLVDARNVLLFAGVSSPKEAVARAEGKTLNTSTLRYLNRRFKGRGKAPFVLIDGRLAINPKTYTTLIAHEDKALSHFAR